MYPVKPIYATNDASGIDVGNVMYPMRPVYGQPSTSTEAAKATDLVARQEALISQLENQMQRVDALLTEGKSSIQAAAHRGSTPRPAVKMPSVGKVNIEWPQIAYPVDVVLNVNPSRCPVTPWALRELLGSSVLIRTHVHSSYTGPIAEVANDNENANRTQGVKLIFTVVFRDVKDVEFMVDPIHQTMVRGEANLFRYLCRTFPLFAPLNVFQETLSDHYVDLVCSGIIAGKSKEQQNALKTLNVQLGKQKYLVGDALSPADFCLFSALNKLSLSAPSNIQTWQQKVAAAF